jgi:hypothetical protein
MFFDLSLTGPMVEWITEDTCLPNQYIPVKDGDFDYPAIDDNNDGIKEYEVVAVEYMPYKTTLIARCAKMDLS